MTAVLRRLSKILISANNGGGTAKYSLTSHLDCDSTISPYTIQQ